MLRRVRPLFSIFNGGAPGGKIPRQPDGNPIAGIEGVPSYGNMYAGRVNAGDYNPPRATNTKDKTTEALFRGEPVTNADDPVVRAKLDRCPYFALCDMVVWQGMDPNFLDPGYLTEQEHQLLLLHSRAYYEKWKEIHAKPRQYGPQIRIKKGQFKLIRDVLDMLQIDKKVQQKLNDMLVDDSSLIAMNPKLWLTAHMTPTLRDQLTGRVLETAGMSEYQQARLFDCLKCMRKIRVVRKDSLEQGHTYSDNMWTDRFEGEDDNVQYYPYSAVRTLFDLSSRLGIDPYQGQVKLYNYYDETGTRLTLTINNEDSYFDFLVHNFFDANLNLYGMEAMTRYTLVVESFEATRTENGRWF